MWETAVPLQLNPGDTDSDVDRWRSAVRRCRPSLMALGLAVGGLALIAASSSTGAGTARALALQAVIGVACTPLLAAPATTRTAAWCEWLLAGAALLTTATGLLALAHRSGPGTAAAQLGVQAALQVVPQAVASRLRAPRLLGGAAAGSQADHLRRLVATSPSDRRTVLRRRLAHDPAGDLVLLAEEQWWDRRGSHTEVVVRPAGRVVRTARLGRPGHRVAELTFADGSQLGLHLPGVRLSRVLGLAAGPVPAAHTPPTRGATA